MNLEDTFLTFPYLFDNPAAGFFEGFENFIKGFINLFYNLLVYSKFITILILFCLGFFSIIRSLNLSKMNNLENSILKMNFRRNIDISQLISGIILIFLAFSFITNILPVILIWILEPIPDELIYSLLSINKILELFENNEQFSLIIHDLLNYLFSLISFIAFLQITLSIWFMASHRFHVINPNRLIFVMLSGLIEGILFGFVRCFYFMI
ncbi:MAG: hypothetical protein EU550_02580 [Promethearchaeota archaeon]|nr:MAG: hypothetical protein EU550_02580 [Candidatus Lokiarchaeota archaeon]